MMRYKPDWQDACRRLTALWNDEITDRPCIAVTAPNGKIVRDNPLPSDPKQKWLDIDWVKRDITNSLENTWWGGEAIPSYLLMGGWTVCLGGNPKFAWETIWFDTIDVDFSQPSPFRYSNNDTWITAYTDLYEAVADLAGKNDFLVGGGCILPANDLLAMLMGTENFLIGIMDHPDWMRQAIIVGAQEQLNVRLQLRDRIRKKHDFWYGIAGWMPFWAPEPFSCTQSDVSCMLSPDMFERFILPEIEMSGDAFGNIWYHLDGGNARQHLPRLLSLPYLRVIQYVPTPNEPPNGPAHLDLYREIQAAGKIVHIGIPKENIKPLVRELGPERLMLQTRCDSIAEGEVLLEAAANWI